MRQTLFVLSPAYCGGRRALQLLNSGAELPLARRLREPPGVPLGEAFSFMSGLYFRGKLAYARRFACARQGTGVHVITPGRGLLDPEHRVRHGELLAIAEIPVALEEPRYRRPLERDAGVLADSLAEGDAVVLLGSIATDKYIEVLAALLADRLHVPAEFLGRGDMSRGALMLRSVQLGRELSYIPVAGAPMRGPRARRVADMI